MWVAASQPGFAHVLFLDSDAAVVGNTSVEDFFVDGHRNVLFGTAVSRAPLVFFSNRPWGLKSPCSGVFLAQPHAGAAADMLRDWWDFPAPDRDFSHAFEQDALWRSLALNTTQYNNRLAPDKISVIDEFAFLDASTSDPPRWVRHWTGPDQHRREKLMRPFILAAGYDDESFARRVNELVHKGNVLYLDVIDVAEKMALLSIEQAS